MVRLVAVTAALVLFVARPAFSSDGVIEINQAAALAGGVTPGDTPGFPVTLSQQGSYRLTGNLDSPIGAGAIEITELAVTLDLNRFAVRSTNTCLGYPTTSCTVAAGSPGILSNQGLVTVRNGTVHGMGGDCVSLFGGSSEVDQVRAFGCGGDGIEVGAEGRVTRSFGGSSRAVGIRLGDGGVAQANEGRGNTGNGIVITSTRLHGHLLANRAFDNGGGGIIGTTIAGLEALASQNVAGSNGLAPLAGVVSSGDNLCNAALC